MVAVLLTSTTAVSGVVPVRAKVAVPPGSRLTDVAMLPVPPAEPQAEPALATHVQEAFVSSGGIVSATVAPVTGVGPALVATMV